MQSVTRQNDIDKMSTKETKEGLMKYRRSRTKGATYFFTVLTYKRKRILCKTDNVKIIKEAFRHVALQRPFLVDAFVMLPDHIHCIWTLPDDDNDFSTRWRLIKGYFTRRCDKKYRDEQSDNMQKKCLQGIWQQRFWEHTIRSDRDFAAHVDYIHYNPVKHGLVKKPRDWEHSTFNKYVKAGVYDINWGTTEEMIFEDSVGNE